MSSNDRIRAGVNGNQVVDRVENTVVFERIGPYRSSKLKLGNYVGLQPT